MMKKKIITIIIWGALLGAGLSLIKLLGFFALNVDYPFEPVSDLLMVLAFVACLYMGIKKVRDKHQDGLIKYTHAFTIGMGITCWAYIIMVGFLMLHYQFIDTEGVQRINQQNLTKAETTICKDTATQIEINNYLSKTQEIIEENSRKLGGDSLVASDSLLHLIINQQWANVGRQNHTIDTHLGTFAKSAAHSLCCITENVLAANATDTSSSEHVRKVISASQTDIEAFNPATLRMERIREQIPQSKNAYEAAFKHSFAILLYGIMLDIFVALFLFRNEHTVCSRNDNLNENEEPSHEEDSSNENESTENKQ